MVKTHCQAGTCKRYTYRSVGKTKWYCWQHLSHIKEGTVCVNVCVNDVKKDRECSKCQKTMHKDKLLLCEEMECECATHIYCLEQKLPFVPLEPWYCPAHNLYGKNIVLEDILPEPGTKIMVLMNSELVWWPAVVVPTDAAYLPKVLPRKGGALDKKRTFKEKTRTNKISMDPKVKRPTIVAAYYGQPFGTNSEFTVIKLDWDRIKKLDFESPFFASPSKPLSTALHLARRFDLDTTNKGKFAYKSCKPVHIAQEEDPQTAVMLYLMEKCMNLKALCTGKKVKFAIVKKWLCRGSMNIDEETTAALSVVYELIGRVYVPPLQAPVCAGRGRPRKRVLSATQGSTPRVASPKNKRPKLASLWMSKMKPPPALQVTFGIEPATLAAWEQGKRLAKHEADYIETVVRHVIGWELGFDELPAN